MLGWSGGGGAGWQLGWQASSGSTRQDSTRYLMMIMNALLTTNSIVKDGCLNTPRRCRPTLSYSQGTRHFSPSSRLLSIMDQSECSVLCILSPSISGTSQSCTSGLARMAGACPSAQKPLQSGQCPLARIRLERVVGMQPPFRLPQRALPESSAYACMLET